MFSSLYFQDRLCSVESVMQLRGAPIIIIFYYFTIHVTGALCARPRQM